MNSKDKESIAKFRGHGDDGYVDMAPGILRRTLVHGEHTLLASFRLAAGSRIPEHSHPQEQTGYLVSGNMTFHIGGAARETRPGDAWTIPGDVPHAVDVHEDSVAIEVFSPVRKDYL
jgi:quercetin dioxygenase-like cupin family protein